MGHSNTIRTFSGTSGTSLDYKSFPFLHRKQKEKKQHPFGKPLHFNIFFAIFLLGHFTADQVG